MSISAEDQAFIALGKLVAQMDAGDRTSCVHVDRTRPEVVAAREALSVSNGKTVDALGLTYRWNKQRQVFQYQESGGRWLDSDELEGVEDVLSALVRLRRTGYTFEDLLALEALSAE